MTSACDSIMLLVSVLTMITVTRGVESSVISSCDNKLSLQCPGPGEMIVVREAAFTPLSAPDCRHVTSSRPVMLHNNRDILLAVIRRCNGLRDEQCMFDLHSDLPESVSWGEGRIEVSYTCETEVLSYCGGRVSVSGEGFISSPGYPRYYLGGRECVWSIVADPGQRIRLEVVDLALRDTGDKCEDSVEVREEGLTLLSMCADLEGRADIVSSSRSLKLMMRTAPSGQSVYSQRGLLLHYNVEGCPTPGETMTHVSDSSHS